MITIQPELSPWVFFNEKQFVHWPMPTAIRSFSLLDLVKPFCTTEMV